MKDLKPEGKHAKDSMKKVGIYAGTFDPVHNGHLQFAQDAIKQVGLEKVFFMVESNPRRKQGVKAFEHRLNMARLAISDNPSLGMIILEQERFTAEDTLPVLLSRFIGVELWLLMGDDALKHLGEWPMVERLTSNVKFIIAARHGSEKSIHDQFDYLRKVKFLNASYRVIKSRYPDISSSRVKFVIRQGRVAADLPDAVSEYIKDHGIYVSKEES